MLSSRARRRRAVHRVEHRRRVIVKYLLPDVMRKAGECRKRPRALGVTDFERIVGSEHDQVGAREPDRELDRLGRLRAGVEIELVEIIAGRLGDLAGEIGIGLGAAGLVGRIEPSLQEQKSAAAVGEQDSRGKRSRKPPKIMRATANEVSAGHCTTSCNA